MATDSTIDCSAIVLRDVAPPGPVRPDTLAAGEFTNSNFHNVLVPRHYKLGERIVAYDDGSVTGSRKGWCTFMYAKVYAQDATVIVAMGLCTQDVAADQYAVTNDPDSCLLALGGPWGCVALSAMTNLYHGWFLVAGPYPEHLVPAFGGTVPTDGNVAVGGVCTAALVAGVLGLGSCIDTTASVARGCIGYATIADT